MRATHKHYDFKEYRFLLLLVFTLFAKALCAQEIVLTGVITDVNNNVLARASVVAVDSLSNIIAYTSSNEKGIFSLKLDDLKDGKNLLLEVNYLGFKPAYLQIKKEQYIYDFSLEEDETALNEIVIKNRPVVKRNGDTIRYRVTSFQKTEDRSIGDVLERMPGVQVDDDGTIFYNGSRISNLYIHGDDLMNGKYGLATRAIRKEDILGVDVILNHQPINVLQDKILTNSTAMNLLLKDENSMSLNTHADLALGVPDLYDVSLTPILLNKKIKILNTVAINNAAVDYQEDFKQLGNSNLRSDISANQGSVNLSLGTVGPPNLPKRTYYRNASKVINLNDLYTTDNGLQLKINLQAFADRNILEYNSYVANFTAGDTISFSENQELTQNPKIFTGAFTVVKNKDSNFLQNKFALDVDDNHSNALIQSNQQDFDQYLYIDAIRFSNDFNWIPSIGSDGVVELRWFTSYKRDEKSLLLGDGYNSTISDFEGMNERVDQSLNSPTFYSNAYVSYLKSGAHFKQHHELGYLFEDQTLNSDLRFKNGDQYQEYNQDAGNRLQWLRQQLYFKPKFQLVLNKVKASLDLPLIFQNISYDDLSNSLNKHKRDFLFNPNLSFKYQITPEEHLSANCSFDKKFGNIAQIYRGSILRDYRSLIKNEADLFESKQNSLGITYNLEKAVSLFFLNARASYEHLSTNAILSYNIDADGQTVTSLPIENDSYNYKFDLGLSKYVFAINNALSLRIQYDHSISNGFINEALVPVNNDVLSFSSSFSKSFFSSLKIQYKPNLSFNYTVVNRDNINSYDFKTVAVDQTFELMYKSKKSWDARVDFVHSYTEQSKQPVLQYLFCDFNANYAIKKNSLDLGLSVNNIFNVKKYQVYAIDKHQYFASSYQLRGIMALVRVEWFF